MYRDRDAGLTQELPPGAANLTQDLELGALFQAMAAGDDFLFEMAQQAVLSPLPDPEAITYRQQVLADTIAQPAVAWEIYDIAVAAITRERRAFFGLLSNSPDSILFRSMQVLEMFTGMLKRLRAVADEHAASFRSEGFTRFFRMLTEELDDEYLQVVEGHLRELGFRRGTLISAGLGRGNKGTGYVLRKPRDQLAEVRYADREQAGVQLLHTGPRRQWPPGPV